MWDIVADVPLNGHILFVVHLGHVPYKGQTSSRRLARDHSKENRIT